MQTALISGAVALLVALVGAAATIMQARRARSGSVQTSEAADLWAESKAMRESLERRLERSEERVGLLEEKVTALERETRACQRRERTLTRRLEEAGLL